MYVLVFQVFLSVSVLLAIAQPFGYLSKIIVCSLHLPPCISLKSNGAKGLTVKIVCYSSCCDLFTVHSQTIYIFQAEVFTFSD